MAAPLFETTNRKLEGFLYVHDIHWSKTYVAPDGMTTWVYEMDEDLSRTVEEYRMIAARRAERRRAS